MEDLEPVNVPEGLKVELITEKLTVTLRGPSAQVANITLEDIHVTVDFTGAEPGTSTFKATVVYGDGFEQVGTLKTESVSAKIDKK